MLPSAQASFFVRINGVATANTYYQATALSATNGVYGNTTFNPNAGTSIAAAVSNNEFFIQFPDYTNTNKWKMVTSDGYQQNTGTTTNLDFYRILGMHNQTAAITSLSIHMESPKTFTSGTVLLYGVK